MNLNVPVLSEQPLIVAETRPAKITKFLSALPVTNALETSLALQDELEILNRQKVAPDTRIKALETYRPAVISATESLASHYCTTALPLPEQEKQYAVIANTLWAEIAFGYKLAVIDLEAKLFKFGSNKLLALSLQRALDALRMQIVIYYETYRALPRSLWAELHQIFSLARARDLADQEIDSGSQEREVSISHVYKQALLLSLTDPQHLSPREIKLVCDYIMRFAHLAQLQPANNLENTAAIFLVSTGRDKPPVPLSKRLRNIDGENDLLLLTMDVARQVHLHIKQGQSGPFPPGAGLPDSANQPRYLDLLNYLLRHWGAAPKRIYSRTPKNDGIELVIGLPAIHRVLSNQPATPNEDNIPVISRPLSSRWQVLNISAGGMALRKLPAAEVQVHVGDLVCIKINPTSHWALGVLRWANHTENRHLDIGLQMLAPDASAINVHSATLTSGIPMLLLPEIPVIKQTASLIGNPGSYGPAKILDIEQADGMQRIMITRLIERTNHFDHFQFSPL